MARRVIILGSTGSIGTQAIDVLEHLNALGRAARAADARGPEFEIVGLAAGTNASLLREQARRLGVGHIAIGDLADTGSSAIEGNSKVFRGPDAAERLVREVECDLVIAAIVGVAGLAPTLAAIELGRDVALANKETLVAAGSLVVSTAARTGSRLLPVDSEHSALWQCLLGASPRHQSVASPPFMAGAHEVSNVVRATLTASGGPFREWTPNQLARATPADALKHPTWSMGAKITVDCATLMNKSLELIEAFWLFGLREDQLGMLVHPQSVVHAMVETTEGAVLAQMAAPDMRTPLQFAISHPHRHAARATPLDFTRLSRLDFAPVDTNRFPAADAWRLALGAQAHTTSGAILNAANEEAVKAFLGAPDSRSGARAESISFPQISDLVLEATHTIAAGPIQSIHDVLSADAQAREHIWRQLSKPRASVTSLS